jgi:hypothetical protein
MTFIVYDHNDHDLNGAQTDWRWPKWKPTLWHKTQNEDMKIISIKKDLNASMKEDIILCSYCVCVSEHVHCAVDLQL